MLRLLWLLSAFVICALTFDTGVLAGSTHDVVSLASGRRLDFTANGHLSSTLEAGQIGRERLYEITKEYRLIGHDRLVDLRPVLTGGELIPVPRLRAAVPGDNPRTREAYLEPIVRVGSGYVVAYLTDGSLLAVWGSNLSLTPLDHKAYPGVFFHTPIRMPDAVDFRGDIAHVPTPTPNSPLVRDKRTDTTLHHNDEAHLNQNNSIQTSTRQSDACLNREVVKEAEMAFAFDSRLCKRYSTAERTIAAARAALAVAKKPYEEQTCIRLKEVYIEGQCDADLDPYKDYDLYESHRVLDEFAMFWYNERKAVHRDAAVFLTGFSNFVETSGVAFIGAACLEMWGCAWAEGLEPVIMAHEIAHLFGADHAPDGLMKAQWTADAKLEFSPFSISEISDFIDNKPRSQCLSTIQTNAPAPTPLPTNSPTPSATPSEAFVVTTAPPPTQPSPSPSSSSSSSVSSPLGVTCGDHFAQSRAFHCTTPRSYDAIDVTKRRRAKRAPLLLRVRQAWGSLTVVFRGKNSFRITKLKQRLSMSANPLSRLSGVRIDKNGKSQILLKLPVNDLESDSSCCGRQVFINFVIKLCKQTLCIAGKSQIGFEINCVSCKPRKRFIPSSPSRRCPFCKKNKKG